MHRLMCVKAERTAIVGKFYSQIADIDTDKLFDTAITTVPHRYNFELV